MMSKSNNSIRLFSIIAVIAIAIGIYAQQSQKSSKALPSLSKAVILPNTKPLEYVDFIDHNGAQFNKQHLLGYWSIIFFGFTNCPDICPTTMRTLQQVKQQLSRNDEWGNYRVIMVSVDPERDSQERLKNYVPYFDEEFIGLRADVKTTTDFAKQLGILFVKQKSEDEFYQVDHSASLILVNPAGEMAGVITAPHNQQQISDDLALLANHFADDHATPPKPINDPTENQNVNHAQSKHQMPHPSADATSSNDQNLLDQGSGELTGITISDAWIRPAPANVSSMAGYLKIQNQSETDLVIVAVESPSFGMAMIHETMVENETAKMQHLDELVVPAGGEITLEPFGLHLMLMRPHDPLAIGDTTSITLISESGAELTQIIEVKQPQN